MDLNNRYQDSLQTYQIEFANGRCVGLRANSPTEALQTAKHGAILFSRPSRVLKLTPDGWVEILGVL